MAAARVRTQRPVRPYVFPFSREDKIAFAFANYYPVAQSLDSNGELTVYARTTTKPAENLTLLPGEWLRYVPETSKGDPPRVPFRPGDYLRFPDGREVAIARIEWECDMFASRGRSCPEQITVTLQLGGLETRNRFNYLPDGRLHNVFYGTYQPFEFDAPLSEPLDTTAGESREPTDTVSVDRFIHAPDGTIYKQSLSWREGTAPALAYALAQVQGDILKLDVTNLGRLADDTAVLTPNSVISVWVRETEPV